MAALPELQTRVMDALLHRGERADALLRCSPGTAIAPAQRLQIYRNNLYQSLSAALGAVYPVVGRLVGTGFFGQMAYAYIRAHPSRSGDLHEFGGELPHFLRGFEPAASLVYLADVAALEWAYHGAYHDAELPPLDPALLSAVPLAAQPELRVHIQPAARFVESRYPILAIWQANQPRAIDDDTPISLDEGGVKLLVVQHELEIEFRLLGDAEDRWLRALADNASLAAATRAALEFDPAFDLAAAMTRHLMHGLFTGFSVAEELDA